MQVDIDFIQCDIKDILWRGNMVQEFHLFSYCINMFFKKIIWLSRIWKLSWTISCISSVLLNIVAIIHVKVKLTVKEQRVMLKIIQRVWWLNAIWRSLRYLAIQFNALYILWLQNFLYTSYISGSHYWHSLMLNSFPWLFVIPVVLLGDV